MYHSDTNFYSNFDVSFIERTGYDSTVKICSQLMLTKNKTKQNKTKNQTPRLNLQNIILETIKKDDKMGISETHDEMDRT